MAKRLSLVLETKRFDFGTSFKVAKVVVAQVDRESLEIAFDDEGVGVASALVISIYFQKQYNHPSHSNSARLNATLPFHRSFYILVDLHIFLPLWFSSSPSFSTNHWT
jgi:hypothetical protein